MLFPDIIKLTNAAECGDAASFANDVLSASAHPTSLAEAAIADLDEAWEIAERGPMPLYQADILRHRARLFFREVEYPWRNEDGSPRSAKADLAEARRLIEKHGYWRRKEELEDAEAVIVKLA